MSELRNRTLVPPPPRHPGARPPSPLTQPRSNTLNVPPPPVHPSLPPRPPPSPQQDARLEYFSSESIPSQAATFSVPRTPPVQIAPLPVPANRPGNPRSTSGGSATSVSSVDVKSIESPVPPPKHPSVPPELPPPISRTSSLSSITAIPPPVHHARQERSLTLDSAHEATLSEQELRDLYDDEEIDRFIRLFSAYVKEVKLDDGGQSTAKPGFTATLDSIVLEDAEDNDDKDWVSLNDAGQSLGLPHDNSQPRTICEQIAQKFVAPCLPKTAKTIPPFTVLRFRLTIQRLYLTLEPGYQFIIDNLVSLALWEDKNWSFGLCLGYWVLWVHNLLLPAFIFYLLYVLLHRRMHPYPSLAQLREHRGHIDKANEFGEELQARLTASTPFGLLDAWKTLKVYNNKKLEKVKHHDDAARIDGDNATAAVSGGGVNDQDSIKALGLEALCELVDGLERFKNLFLWRKPPASYAFSIALGIIGSVTLILPAQWLAKITYLVLGFAFWHIPPILAALPAGDHRRLLALLHNVPTDADYAMELISQRVAQGQEIKPLNRKRAAAKNPDTNDPSDVAARGPDEDGKSSRILKQGVSVLKTVADTVGGQRFINNFAPAAVRDAAPQGGSRSYPAQRGKVPGVITVSPEKFYFTPLLSGPKLEIPVGDIVGIKKAMPKGISIRAKDVTQEGGERKEKFLLVYERDELFGRLVGTGGKKWTRI